MNEVRIAGRVSAPPQAKRLPSGDEIVTLRLIVPRPRRRGDAGSRQKVDVIDVTLWSARTRRSAGALGPDDVVEVEGALHRRFFRTPGGTQSRYEVAATTVRRTSRAHRAAGVRSPTRRAAQPQEDLSG